MVSLMQKAEDGVIEMLEADSMRLNAVCVQTFSALSMERENAFWENTSGL